MSVATLVLRETIRRATDIGGATVPYQDLIRRLGLRPGRAAFIGYCPTCEQAGLRLRLAPGAAEVWCTACGDPGLVHLSMLRTFPAVRLRTPAGRTT